MLFCEKCGALMIPKKEDGKSVIACTKCKYVSHRRESLILRERGEVRDKKHIIEVVDKRVDTLPKTKEDCPKCGHKEAFYWTVQTRAADEAETRFFKCVKCAHTWRSYS